MSDVLEENDEMEDTTLNVKGDIMIQKSLLIESSQSDATVSTEVIIQTIGKLLKQESTLIESRYISLNKFCNGLIKYLSYIVYLNQHLNNYYFQDQWTINDKIQELQKLLPYNDYYNVMQSMKITVLPTLQIFNYDDLYIKGDGIKTFHFASIPGLFQETFAIDLLPGIYVYNFRKPDDTTTEEEPSTVKVIRFKYNVADSSNASINRQKHVSFEPRTIYYIKQKNTTEENITITDEGGNDNVYTYLYKCVVMMSGIDLNAGLTSEDTDWKQLTSDQIYYEEYYVDNSYKIISRSAKMFNVIDRPNINSPSKEDTDPSLKYTQPTEYWTVNTFKSYDEDDTPNNELIGQQPSLMLAKFIKDLKSGDIGQWCYYSSNIGDVDSSKRLAYIFKLSDDQFLMYNMNILSNTSPVELSLNLKTIPQPTNYYVTNICVTKNPK